MSSISLNHDWKAGERLGEASNPGSLQQPYCQPNGPPQQHYAPPQQRYARGGSPVYIQTSCRFQDSLATPSSKNLYSFSANLCTPSTNSCSSSATATVAAVWTTKRNQTAALFYLIHRLYPSPFSSFSLQF